MIDLSGPLTTVSLTWQLATGGGDLTPPSYFTVAPIPAPSGAPSHGGLGHGHPLHVTGSRAVASTSGDVIDLRSGAASGTNVTYTFYSMVLVIEVGTYASDQIVDDIRFTAKMHQAWVPPTVRHHQRR